MLTHDADELEKEAQDVGEVSWEVTAIIERLRSYRQAWSQERDDAADLLPFLDGVMGKCEAQLDAQPNAKINERIRVLRSDVAAEWNRIRNQPITASAAENKLSAEFTAQGGETASIFQQWLYARGAGASAKHWDGFLAGFTLGNLTDSLRAYVDRLAAENAVPSNGIPLPVKDVDELLATSKTIGPNVRKGLDQGKKATETICVLKDLAFQEAFIEDNWKGYCAGKIRFPALDRLKKAGKDDKVLRAMLRFSIGRKIDRVTGFTSTSDRAIYLRLGELTPHALIHEAIHKYAGERFHWVFGRTINEGATEFFTRAAMKEVGLESAIGDHYPDELEIVLDLQDTAKIKFELLKKAYFDDEGMEEILAAIQLNEQTIKATIGAGHYQTLLEEMGNASC